MSRRPRHLHYSRPIDMSEANMLVDALNRLEADLAAAQAERDALRAAWETAKRQNSHDMLLSGDEIHQHDAAIAREVK